MPLDASRLPDFPWDSMVPVRKRAAAHPGGLVDLTIGTPVDPVPEIIQQALREESDSPGYPATIGSPELREAIFGWLARRRGVGAGASLGGVAGASLGVLPTIGSKEMVALLPSLLGLGTGDVVAFPQASYPTYDVGARLTGATPCPIDTDANPDSWPENISMLWLNSPGNPNGHVLGVEQLRRILAWARARGVVVASDECYAELVWEVPEAPSILDQRVCDGDYRGIFCLYSLSKQSNLAGYRAAFLAGDPERVAAITEIRKHAGFMMPAPVQHAMAVGLNDTTHIEAQREVYRRRREALRGVLEAAGLIDDPACVAGLYLWAADRRGSADCWEIVNACARLGIVVTPGVFYGEAGRKRVRIALTAHDGAITEAVRRLPLLPEELERAQA